MAELTELERAAVERRKYLGRIRWALCCSPRPDLAASLDDEALEAILAAVVPMVLDHWAGEFEAAAKWHREDAAKRWSPEQRRHQSGAALGLKMAAEQLREAIAREATANGPESAPEATGEADGSGVTVEAPEGSETGLAWVSGVGVVDTTETGLWAGLRERIGGEE